MSRLLEIDIIEVLEEGSLCREELSEILKTPRTTIYDHLIRLKKKGLVEFFEEENRNKKGRRRVLWRLKVLESTIYHLEQELERLKGDPIDELIYKFNRLKIKQNKGVEIQNV